MDGNFYVFGGSEETTDYKRTIGKLDATTFIWSKAGALNSGRDGHNVIFDGAHFLVIGGGGYGGGGYGNYETERCTLVNDQMTCANQNPALTDYYIYPELFLVPLDFCEL